MKIDGHESIPALLGHLTGYHCYTLIRNGRVLYVGASRTLKIRIQFHSRHLYFTDVEFVACALYRKRLRHKDS